MTQEEYTKNCIAWINLSAFFARCIAAGLERDDPSACKFPSDDIPEALEPENEYMPGIDTDFRVMVATQYILIAEEKIRERLAESWAAHSEAWEKKLEELEDVYENGFLDAEPLFEIPPGVQTFSGTGDLGMDVLGSVKAARKKLKELREGGLGKKSEESADSLGDNEEVTKKEEVTGREEVEEGTKKEDEKLLAV